MAYDDDFYVAYAAYLKEPGVRRAHDSIFRMIRRNPAFRKVLDLGCGRFNEFLHYARPRMYVGVDIHAQGKNTARRRLVAADYRAVDRLRELAGTHQLTAMVSLFSTEITAPVGENYRFYEQLFQATPSLQVALVSGFYYHRKRISIRLARPVASRATRPWKTSRT